MTDDTFWEIIAPVAAIEDPEEQLTALHAALKKRSADDVASFYVAYRRQMAAAYTWDLWGAAYVINGGASDDGFEYFRSWLIAQGREVFTKALADPDSLADVVEPDLAGGVEHEEFAYVAVDVYAQLTGGSKNALIAAAPPDPAEPAGTPFDEDEAYLKKRYPRLWALTDA
jgi:hypothetical protein